MPVRVGIHGGLRTGGAAVYSPAHSEGTPRNLPYIAPSLYFRTPVFQKPFHCRSPLELAD